MKLIPIKFVYVFLVIVLGLLISFWFVDLVRDNANNSNNNENEYTRVETATDLNADPYVIDLSGQNLTKLPEFIWEKPNITHLILTDNNLKNLPSDITKFTKLRVLKVDYNELEELIPEIADLNLVELDVSHNNINLLTNQIGRLRNLDYLDLSNNRLSDLPVELLTLNDLEWINLTNNKIPIEQINQLKAQIPFLIVDY